MQKNVENISCLSHKRHRNILAQFQSSGFREARATGHLLDEKAGSLGEWSTDGARIRGMTFDQLAAAGCRALETVAFLDSSNAGPTVSAGDDYAGRQLHSECAYQNSSLTSFPVAKIDSQRG